MFRRVIPSCLLIPLMLTACAPGAPLAVDDARIREPTPALLLELCQVVDSKTTSRRWA